MTSNVHISFKNATTCHICGGEFEHTHVEITPIYYYNGEVSRQSNIAE